MKIADGVEAVEYGVAIIRNQKKFLMSRPNI
jgi:hypothetical protein